MTSCCDVTISATTSNNDHHTPLLNTGIW